MNTINKLLPFDMDIIEKRSRNFDGIIESAINEKYKYEPLCLKIISNNPKIWSSLDFFNIYKSDKNFIYSLDRLGTLCAQIEDVRLQFFYIMEIDLSLYNTTLYGESYDPKNPNRSPLLLLRRLSYDQNLIVKSRILWEKIMNFIYFLEKGEQIEKLSARKSKKSTFFNFIKVTEKWNFLSVYEDIIKEHDDKYRTPEVHKGSVLKKELIASNINDAELLKVLNYASNCIWENILLIISGEKPIYSVYNPLRG